MLSFLLMFAFVSPQDAKPADSMKDCPLHEQHMKAKEAKANSSDAHHHEVNAHGEAAQGMGFSQTDSLHRFHETKNGAVIEVQSKSADDAKLISQIRDHMKYIAASFTKGDFSTPLFVHGVEPTGIARMKQLNSQIAYKYVELPKGAQVEITSKSPEAIKALHDFMQFQSVEHRSELVEGRK
jgi:hypothetical protein